LTPIECERLQGFPDCWTQYGIFHGKLKKKDIKFRDKHPDLWKECQKIHGEDMILREISDSQRYKVCGNAVTTNVIRDIITALYF
jgi:DNA (cytosine-5)-methyltransferase 1